MCLRLVVPAARACHVRVYTDRAALITVGICYVMDISMSEYDLPVIFIII